MNLFSTNYLFGVVSSLLQPPTFFLERYFPNELISPTEEIHFDVIDRTRRLAPFVSPVVAGKVVNEQGYTTKTFKPAYIKPKTPFSPNTAIKRVVGEALTGNLSPLQRQQVRVNNVLMDHIDIIYRRLEWMAVRAIVDGQVTVQGDNYPQAVINFGRKNTHTVTLTSTARWGQSAGTPLPNLDAWKLIALKTCGANLNDVIMDPDAWAVFKADADVKTRFQRFVGGNLPTLATGAPVNEGATFMGTIDGYNIWVYAAWYIDDAGVEQPMLASGTVILTGPQVEGVRAFGAILDEGAWAPGAPGASESPGLMNTPIFPKSWVENDPPVRYVMCQTAPLMVPTRPNATFKATVL